MPKADEPPVSVELKACPFCGADGELIERRNPLSKWRYSVDCSGTTCGMSGPVEATKAEAIAAWNNRTAPQPVGREAGEAMVEAGSLPETLRERASYLRAFIPEGLSQIEKQSMEVMDLAANELDRLNLAIRSAYVTLNRDATFAEKTPDFLLHVIRGGRTQDFDAALSGPAGGDASPDLTTQIARLLAADPVCGGRVASGTIEAIARLFGPAGADAGEDGWKRVGVEHWAGTNFETRDEKAERLSSPDRFAEGFEETLKSLALAVQTYRHEHDLYGDGSPQAGRAWDLMRRAVERGAAAIRKINPTPPSLSMNEGEI